MDSQMTVNLAILTDFFFSMKDLSDSWFLGRHSGLFFCSRRTIEVSSLAQNVNMRSFLLPVLTSQSKTGNGENYLEMNELFRILGHSDFFFLLIWS